ncbi:hypothetical protein [Metabacillus bambusae]|uniref:Uncharacterized protein n=1 Tax=Metabacillus bambusae TaxID=2795218 RepID=A0ABS3N9S6_9BACI|nr:hypothetical protein [Metabacillus bambusae]MBO1515029.1 hypothetical protein [Metabacillus bambusae]
MNDKLQEIITILDLYSYHHESEYLKKTFEELLEYKKAYYSLKKAGVDLPYVKSI